MQRFHFVIAAVVRQGHAPAMTVSDCDDFAEAVILPCSLNQPRQRGAFWPPPRMPATIMRIR
jgi:hypothetical protein